MKNITIKETELRSMIRGILSEIITTTDLTNPSVSYGFATSDLRNIQSRNSDSSIKNQAEIDPDCVGVSSSIIDLNSPDWPPLAAKKFRAFFAELTDKGYTDISITSGIRSVQKQIELGITADVAATPGKSDHQYGYAIDINVTHPSKGRLKMNSTDGWEDVEKIANNHDIAWEGSDDAVHFKIKGIKATQRYLHPRLAGCGPVGPEWACKGACNEPWKIISGRESSPDESKS